MLDYLSVFFAAVFLAVVFLAAAFGLAALAVLVEVVFGTTMFGMSSVVDNITGLIQTLGDGGFVGLIATLVLWSIIDRK